MYDDRDIGHACVQGMTLREYAAIHLLAAKIIAAGQSEHAWRVAIEGPREAVQLADSLMNHLKP